MGCSRTFTFTPIVDVVIQEEDMPLDQAIYSASQNKIYGVRGKWIFQFNATTGVKENEFRFVDDVIGDSSIVEVGGFLYVGTWNSVLWNATDNNNKLNADIFKIDYTFTSLVPLGLNTIANIQGQNFGGGFRNLVTDGTFILGFQFGDPQMFQVDPTNTATYQDRPMDASPAHFSDLTYDSTNNVAWGACPSNGDIEGKEVSDIFFSGVSTPNPIRPYGLCYCPSNNKVYAVTGTDEVIKANISETLPIPSNGVDFTFSTLTILEAAAKPVRVKYNAVDGLIYIPTWSGDTVEVLDPATDTIVAVKTGFTDPYDVVFTPTKKFAVQNSGVGLREIV